MKTWYRRAEWFLLISACVVVILGTIPTCKAIQYFTQTKNHVEFLDPIDEAPIIQDLDLKNSFLKTLEWWRGPWCGQVPFFRPITSQLFWAEYQLFGPRFECWLTIALLCHLTAVALGYWVISRLLDNRLLAALTIALFAGPEFNQWLGRTNVWSTGFQHSVRTLPLWKNQPEYWVTIPIFSTILLFVAKRYWLVLGGVFVAITTKEVGFALLPALWLMSWYNRQTIPRWFWVTSVALTVVLFVYRYAVLGTLGYTLGTNKAWWYRAIIYYGATLGGAVEGILSSGESLDFPNAIAGIGTGLVVLYLIRPWWFRRTIFVAVAITISSWLVATCLAKVSIEQMKGTGAVSLAEAFFALALVDGNWSLVIIALDVVLIGLTLRFYLREALLCFGLMFLFSAGLFSAAQVTQHAFYLADLFGRSLLVLGLAALVRVIIPHTPFRARDFCLYFVYN